MQQEKIKMFIMAHHKEWCLWHIIKKELAVFYNTRLTRHKLCIILVVPLLKHHRIIIPGESAMQQLFKGLLE